MRLTPEALETLYQQDALAARVIDRLVEDSTREEFTMSRMDETDFDFAPVASALENLDVRGKLGDGWRWARLYGGSLVVMDVNDGNKLEEPLELENARKLNGLRVIESPWVVPEGFTFAMGSNGFREPEHYLISFTNGAFKKVHWTRVIRFDGVKVPPRVLEREAGWGPSVLDRVWTEISQLGESMGYGKEILQRVSIQLYKIMDFRKKLAGSDKDKEELSGMLRNFRNSIDNLNMAIIDSQDELTEANRTVTGITDLMHEFIDALVRATDMPRTVLLGEQPGGLNGNADSEIRSWYDFVRAQQRKTLTPAINRILEVVFAISQNRGEESPDEWVIDYVPLWQPSEKETAETDLLKAQKDDLYIANMVVAADEVRDRLISDGDLDEDAEGIPPDERGVTPPGDDGEA
jgi:phage-related protein (TIGR01555 family)